MINGSFIQRRSFLKRTFMLAVSAFAGTACSLSFSPDLREVAKTATSLLRRPHLAKNIGRHYIQQNVATDSLTPEQLMTRILEGTAIDPGYASHFKLFKMDDEIRRKVRKDFTLERTAKIRGWLLSETEAQLCALLVLIDKA